MMNRCFRPPLQAPASALMTKLSSMSPQLCLSVSSAVTVPAQTWMNAFDFTRFSSTARTRSHRITCPFQTLGLPKQTEYKVVKKQFLKLALQHHPDTALGDKEDMKAKAAAIEMFMRVRKAFEQIIELDNGMAGIRSESEKAMDGDEFNKWFYGETGKYAPDPFDLNLSPETLQEVAEASATQAGLDRGGMWFMAQSLTSGMSAGGQLKLEQGEIAKPQDDNTTTVRRRRKRH